MLSKPCILSLSSTRLINSLKHEHSCKILYFFLNPHLGIWMIQIIKICTVGLIRIQNLAWVKVFRIISVLAFAAQTRIIQNNLAGV